MMLVWSRSLDTAESLCKKPGGMTEIAIKHFQVFRNMSDTKNHPLVNQVVCAHNMYVCVIYFIYFKEHGIGAVPIGRCSHARRCGLDFLRFSSFTAWRIQRT